MSDAFFRSRGCCELPAHRFGDSSFVVRRLENFFLFQTHLGKLIQTVSAHEDCWDIPFLGLLGYSLAGIAREMVVIAITLVPCFAVTVLVAVGRAR